MKRVLPTTLFVLLLCCGGASAQGGKPPEGGGTKTSLTGVVYDPNGAVVVNGVRVVAHGPGGKRYETNTNSEGIYSLSVPLGVYSVEVGAEGFCPSRVERFRVVDASYGKMSLDFVLEVPHELLGCGPGRVEKKPRRKKSGRPVIILE